MHPTNFIIDLKHVLSPEDLSTVTSSLRHEPLVWDKLNQPEYFQKAYACAGSQVDQWNPATLALIALGQNIPLNTLRSLPLQPLLPELRQLAARAFEDTFRTENPPATLEQAGLLALALRERRRLTESWQGLLAELQLNGTRTTVSLDVWSTPIACLYAMAPDPDNMLASLLPEGTECTTTEQTSLVLHALLANPLSLHEKVIRLQALLQSSSVEGQLSWIGQLQSLGEYDLASQLASLLLNSTSAKTLFNRLDNHASHIKSADPLVSPEPAQLTLIREQLGRLYQAAGRQAEALPLLEAARSSLRRQQAALSLEIAQSAAKHKDPNTALNAAEQAYQLAADSLQARTTYANQLLQNGRTDETIALLADTQNQPLSLLISARLSAKMGDLDIARIQALQVVDQLTSNGTKSLPTSLTVDKVVELSRSLLDLNMYEQAASVANYGLQFFPTNLDLLQVASQAYTEDNQLESAVNTAYLSVSIAPREPSLHRLLADVLERSGEWDACMEERNQVLKLSTTPLIEDYLATAASAINANRPEEAIAACQAILDREPDAGLAQAYYGQALAKKGEISAAAQRLTQATLVSPEIAEPWIALSDLHEAAGDHRKAMETLHTAAHAAPQNAEVHLALGMACLEEGSASEALPALRRAASLAPKTASVAQRLAQTLFDLGHLEEASQVLERARYNWPTLPDLSLLQAKTLIGLGDFQGSLPALETTLRTQPKTIEPYMLFGRTMVNLADGAFITPSMHNDLVRARQCLLKVLELDPDNFEARVLIAEAQAAGGDLHEALSTYQELSEMEKATDPAWSWRIHLGMGRAAMDLGQTDTAIAALQEAVQTRPDDLRIHQALAEAYHAANLSEEALVKARTALGMAPHSVANLVWYAHMAVAMKDEGEAINALEHASELTPERADLKNELALVQLQINDKNAARKTLESVLALDFASPADLRQTATHFLELGDQVSAVACLKKAIESASLPSADLWAELACLNQRIGDQSAAIEAIQTALEIRPSDPVLHTLHGNLLASENKVQAAISCYEEALNLTGRGFSTDQPKETTSWTYQPENSSPIQLHLEMANLLRSIGDQRSALLHTEQALQAEPENLEARCSAVETAISLLELEHAADLANWGPLMAIPAEVTDGQPGLVPTEITNQPAALKLLTLQAELFLEKDDIQAAEDALSRAKVFSADDARVLAAMARVAGRRGELACGSALLDEAIAASKSSQGDTVSSNSILPIAEAALELQQWEVSMPLYLQAARNLPLDPMAQLSLARALAKAAEAQRIYADLDVIHHAPGTEKLSETTYQQFERAIMAANRLSNSDLVSRWHKRGSAAFHPAEKTMKSLQCVASTPDDLAALMAAGSFADQVVPIELVNRYPNHPGVLLQKSLTIAYEKPEEALAAAQALVTAQPAHPLYQALLAKMAARTADPALACQAMEAALATWPDEPVWHALAAENCDVCGDYLRSQEHWKQALDLHPDNPEYAYALGKAYLRANNLDDAIRALNRASKLNPSHLETWIALADAHRLNADYPQAIASAEKAISLAPDHVAPLLASGEIALSAGQTELARKRAEAALNLEPGNAKASLLIARTQARQGHTADALHTLDYALEVTSEPFELLLERTRLIHTLQGAPAALQVLQELAAQYPEEPMAQAELASALSESGQKEAAEKAAQAALLLQPDLPSLHLLLGRIQRSSGQLDQAIHHLSEAIRQDPRNVDAYLEMGRAHQDRREHDQALKIYEQASTISPRDARPYYQSGLAMKEMKDYPNAEIMFRKAAGFAPEDVNIRRQLAAIIAINLVHNPQEASLQQ